MCICRFSYEVQEGHKGPDLRLQFKFFETKFQFSSGSPFSKTPCCIDPAAAMVFKYICWWLNSSPHICTANCLTYRSASSFPYLAFKLNIHLLWYKLSFNSVSHLFCVMSSTIFKRNQWSKFRCNKTVDKTVCITRRICWILIKHMF